MLRESLVQRGPQLRTGPRRVGEQRANLRLHPDEVLDRVERRQPRAVEEELARERRPIEGSRLRTSSRMPAMLTDRPRSSGMRPTARRVRVAG
ncbi:MAG: hypothetical protein ACR2H2_03990 [Solirubrobacteraceae bacterium]